MRMSTQHVAALTFIILILLVFASCGKKEEIAAPQNQPPTEPALDVPSGSPPHGSSNQSINPRLCWKCTDPEGDSIFYDVYFDDVDASILVNSDQSEHYYEPNTLNYSTTYFWKVVAKDKAGNKATSPVWVFTTLRAPGLVVSDTLLDFGDVQNQLTFTISNTGDDTLKWNITVDQDWLSVDSVNGTTLDETDTVTVTVDRTAMMCGDYPASIVVDAGFQADTITVNMQVTGLPSLSVTPGSLNYLSTEGVDTLAITNTTPECGALNWSISSPQSWISANPSSGSTDDETDYVIITINRTGLCEGSYGGRVAVASDGGDADVSVTAEVVVTNLSGSYTVSSDCGNVPLSVTFTASLTGGVPPYKVNWDFGDGNTGSGLTISHQYTSLGEHTVTATAGDKCGDSYPLAPKDINVIAAEYVILGQDVTFTDYDYADKGKGGDGSWSAGSETSATGAHASAWCNEGPWPYNTESWANAWAEIGRKFFTAACSGENYCMADLIFSIQYHGKLSVKGTGRSDFDIDVRLYDITPAVDSMVREVDAEAVRITRGAYEYWGGKSAKIANVKIEPGHTYCAYLFLSTGVSIDCSGATDEANADFRKWDGPEQFGAYLNQIRIDFK